MLDQVLYLTMTCVGNFSMRNTKTLSVCDIVVRSN